ncbi:hypothetical protein VST7929_01542 [Vibrio stylophorae]|uniref:NlpC/P60 domain-containing protein n=1 Tax=Vibrio stylophorae TaxID=659351 RepID=A0ABM8ZTN0_9VIBR|nr:NlpC/P60 family protein [Vibrio stylophorae]CAH0533671.1 hypothetical protein VST7929_01542 [Vibrio stylophorae]
MILFRLCRRLLLTCSLFVFAGCASEPAPQPKASTPDEAIIFAGYADFYDDWQGVPYRLGGENKKGIDCSAFTQRAMSAIYAIELPRTTLQQRKVGKLIKWDQRQRGDLVFFQTGKRQYHVGLLVDDQYFMHASTSRGVMVSRLDNPYWSPRIWEIRRF